MDQIIIRDLQAQGIIGVHPHERVQKQSIVFNITMETDLRPAGVSDHLQDTVNYQTISERILEVVEETQYFLIERLAAHLATLILEEYPVDVVHISIDKPQALDTCRSVAVHITRRKE
ncbi:MAG: dihydroneopterin aldolase [Myxococcota bacterium]|nr:dihydroneopterin aldolase [Myxococcota bacterium]